MALLLSLSPFQHIVRRMVPEIVHPVGGLTAIHTVDLLEKSLLIRRARIDQRLDERSGRPCPAHKVLDFSRRAHMIVAGVPARLPDEFERAHGDEAGSEGPTEPSEFACASQSRSRHPASCAVTLSSVSSISIGATPASRGRASVSA